MYYGYFSGPLMEGVLSGAWPGVKIAALTPSLGSPQCFAGVISA